jgi:hypothetical protein
MKMPIIYIEEIKTTLLTLFGRILGFIGGKVDSGPNNTRFMTSPSEFTNFQILNFQLFQFSHLLEVLVIRRKKLPGQIPKEGNTLDRTIIIFKAKRTRSIARQLFSKRK